MNVRDAVERNIEHKVWRDGKGQMQGITEATDAIIDLVRDALTSRDAVDALTGKFVDLWNERAGIEDDTWPDDYHDLDAADMMDESLQAITAALDVVLGEARTG